MNKTFVTMFFVAAAFFIGLFSSIDVMAQQVQPAAPAVQAKPATQPVIQQSPAQTPAQQPVPAPAVKPPAPAPVVQPTTPLAPPAQPAAVPMTKPRKVIATRIAVYDFAPSGNIKPRTAMIVSEAVLAEIRKLDAVSAVGLKEIMEMLAFEQKKQFVGCDAVSCLVELAGALGVDELITGTVGELGESHILTIKRMDLNTAETKKAISKTLKKGNGEEFLSVVGPVVKDLFPEKQYKAGAVAGVTKEFAKRLNPPPLPVWVFATTISAAGAAGVVGLGFALTANSLYGDYTDLLNQSIHGTPVDGSLLKSKQSEINRDNQAATISFIVAGALAAAAIVEVFFTDWKPEAVRPVVTPIAFKDTYGATLSMKW